MYNLTLSCVQMSIWDIFDQIDIIFSNYISILTLDDGRD